MDVGDAVVIVEVGRPHTPTPLTEMLLRRRILLVLHTSLMLAIACQVVAGLLAMLVSLGIERNPVPVYFLGEVFVAIAVHFYYGVLFSLVLNKLVFGDV